MRPLTVTLVLAWRDPARNIALLFGVLAVLLLLVLAPQVSPYWAVLLVAPAFLIGAALTVPTFSPFERALPLTISQLLWSRILASLALIWLPLLMGAGAMLAAEQSLAPLAKPIQSSANFTACACLATSARLAPKRAMERLLALLALGFAILALLAPPRGVAGVIAAAAALPVLGRLWWTYAPVRDRRGMHPFAGHAIWPLLRMVWPWRTLIIVPLAVWFGLDRAWSFLPFAALFLDTSTIPHPYLLGLPVSRRHVLWAILAPVIVSFLVGTAFSPSFQGADEIANFTRPTPKSPWREFYGNPPGLMIPTRYYRTSATFTPPAILAPWGETSQPAGDGRRFGYDPYWVGPENSDRFFEWQFARATRAIYGRAFTPPELRDAIRAGLRPVIEQPRAVVVRMALGTALLLALGLLAALKNWYRLRAVPTALRALLPFWLPVTALLVAQVVAPMAAMTFVPRCLIQLSGRLPSNFALMTLALFAALVPLYWALESVFRQIEFPYKSKETE